MDSEKQDQRSKVDIDLALQEATRRRTAQRVDDIIEPRFPSTGTERVAALLAEARRGRNEAYAAARSKVGRTGSTESAGEDSAG